MSVALRFLGSLRKSCLRSTKLSQPVRFGGGGNFRYRDVPPVTNKTILVLCNVVGFTVWYWMMYKVYHEFDHIVGHFTYPTPSKWTDEELGIPPDDEEE
ncbi:Hypothetical predicted protein [Octopus vulgaris]|uniref:NADH dehydrogenase [ubiquinone] 1 beta subcomplex subunit 2, mitochondrial n=1 Tax=Octopus vulgaris TaxID=6645 RepID=A0AA36BQM2_OCTVU|nr:Hypothetical predicted protein [Octopus vulgaris]